MSAGSGLRYEAIGDGYARTRREDPQVAAMIVRALGSARSVVNVGAGAGSYEARDRHVIAIEPSDVMAAQRPPELAPAIAATAGQLPLRDKSADAAMAVLTVHHWDAELDHQTSPRPERIISWLGGAAEVTTIETTRDTPGWALGSFWAHPERVLDAQARQATSGFARTDDEVVNRVVNAVAADLRTGEWDRRYGHLRELAALDVGLRLIVSQLD